MPLEDVTAPDARRPGEVEPSAPASEPLAPGLPDQAGLATFWELSTELLSITTAAGRFVYANPAWARALGYSQQELTRVDALGLVHPADVEPTREMLRRLAQPGEHTEGFTNRLRAADGTYRTLRWHARSGRDDRIYCVSQDVTDLLLDDRRLRESEERFRLSMAQAAIGMAIVGIDGTFVEVNDALCRILARPREVLTTLTFQDLTHPEDLEADLDLVRQLAAGEIEHYHLEKRYFRADGSVVWALLSGSALRNETGEPRYYLAQVQDITARKTSEARLVSTLEDLQRSNDALTDFASIAAHDLKSPLAVAISGLSLLELRFSAKLPPQGIDVLDRVQQQLGRLSHQVDGLLRIAAMSGMELQLESVDLPALARRVTTDLGHTLGGLQVEFGPCPPVLGDRSALTVLLQNLVENAARHGASRLRVHGRDQPDDAVRVLVDDDGPGIAAPDREAVFELFHHGSASRGSGLGMATCRRVVERHGGRIGIEDGPDGGTRVWVTLTKA